MIRFFQFFLEDCVTLKNDQAQKKFIINKDQVSNDHWNNDPW